MSRPKILVVYGTRPEAIKMAPLVRRLRDDARFTTRVVVTGQHREMVAAIDAFFDIVPDRDLAVMQPGQTLPELSAALFASISQVLALERPDAVVVHGDTASAALTALAGYYAGVQVVHLEAGLRSGDLHSPYPEEGNRRIIGQLAELHLAPTERAALNLVFEQVPPERIAITGNTVIDALHTAVRIPAPYPDPRIEAAVAGGERIVVVTAHRRESWGSGLAQVAEAIADVLATRGDVRIVLPLHPNPLVRAAIEPTLGGHPRVVLTEPLDYPAFSRLLADAYCVVTDSGGIQEEAPSLGKPVLVIRDTTERPEVIDAGAARLVGTDRSSVAAELSALLDDRDGRYRRMAAAGSPYGDGHAAERAVAAIAAHFGLGARLPDFRSPLPMPEARAHRKRYDLDDDSETTITEVTLTRVPIEGWA